MFDQDSASYLGEISYKNRILSFSEYLLSEAIKLNDEVKYGLNAPDFDDKKTKESTYLNVRMDQSTILKLGKYLYVIDIKQQNLFFRSKYFVTTDSMDTILKDASISKRRNRGQMPFGHMTLVFSDVISIGLDLAERHGYQELNFKGFDHDLFSLYKRVMNNKIFLSSLNSAGWNITLDDEIFKLRKTNGI